LFAHYFVHALRAIAYGGGPFSIDMNAIRAIAYGCFSFSIDMNAIRAIAVISRRETISIEKRRLNCFVRRTLTTKSKQKEVSIQHQLGAENNVSKLLGGVPRRHHVETSTRKL
jgi:hypothetical protein